MGVYRKTVTRVRNGRRIREKSRTYRAYFRHPRTNEPIDISLGTTDRKSAEMAYLDAVRRLHQEAAGLTNPYESHLNRSLSDHVDDWHAALLARGTSQKQADACRMRATAIIDGCRFGKWGDLSASSVQSFVKSLRDKGRSAQTCNSYLQAVKQFARWMVSDRRAPDSPIQHLQGYNVREDRRHRRRAATVTELRTLIATTTMQSSRWKMTGPARAMLYRLAAETGLRSSEIRSLTQSSIDLNAKPPTITIEAAYSKHRREDHQPIRVQLARDLADFVAELPPNEPLFTMPSRSAVVRMLRDDLEAAGIPYCDESDRVFDFHAFRHTFITNLANGGVHPRDAKELARHSKIELTLDRYTQPQAVSLLADALDVLPDVSPPENEAEPMRATGTCDADLSPVGRCYDVAMTDADGGSRTKSDAVGHGCEHAEAVGLHSTTQSTARTGVTVTRRQPESVVCGKIGEGGIRTPGTGMTPYDDLANRCFQPLSHLSICGP